MNIQEFQLACSKAHYKGEDYPTLQDVGFDVLDEFYGDLAERGIHKDDAPDMWAEYCEKSVMTEDELWALLQEVERNTRETIRSLTDVWYASRQDRTEQEEADKRAKLRAEIMAELGVGA